MSSPAPRVVLLLAGLVAAISAAVGDEAPSGSSLREGFETPQTSWRREETDATAEIQAHERSSRAAHEGRTSERFAFRAGPGSVLYYSLAVPKVPVGRDLKASVYVRSNRPGVQLFGRVVLPEDLDPDTGRPSFLLVPGETLDVGDRWQRLDLGDVQEELARQARVRRIGTNRKVGLEGAYLERLVLNLYGGAGEAEVFVDEMTVGPIPDDRPEADAKADEPEALPMPGAPGAAPDRPMPKETGRVRLVGNTIVKDDRDWVPTIVDAPGADPTRLRQYGFDVVKLDRDAPNQAAEEAVRAGLMLMPTLPGGPSATPERAVAAAEAFPYRDDVAFWNLGDDLGRPHDLKERKAELDRTRGIVSALRDLPEGRARLTTGTIHDFLPYYALAGRNLDILGIRANDWATIREPFDTYRFLNQRRELTAVKNPRAPFLAWIDATAPEAVARNVWGRDEPPSWGRPQIQPEQVRQQVYAALSAGYRAIGVRGDATMTDESNLPTLMELGLLNAEIDLMESIIAQGSDPIVFWPTFPPDPEVLMIYNALGAAAGANQSRANAATRPQTEVFPHPSIKAASIPLPESRNKGGRLLLVNDYAANSQFQPPQMALNDLKIVIQASENAQAFEVSPAGVQVLERERATGGLKFTLKLFTGTAMILVTTDLSEKARLEAAVARLAPVASEFAIRQARAQIAEAAEINGLLAAQGHTIRDSADLIEKANGHYQTAIAARDRAEYQLSWDESRHVGRTIRHLKWKHYMKARDAMYLLTQKLAKAEDPKAPYYLVAPIMSPPLTSFQTMPQHFAWMSWVEGRQGAFGANLLPGGSFDEGGMEALRDGGWTNVSRATEDVETSVEVLPGAGYGKGNAALRMVVRPETVAAQTAENTVPYLDHEAVAVRTPPIPVHRGGFFRIRVLVRLNNQLPPATGGLIVRDSLGGEQFQMRMTDASALWREITLYRFAPDDGEMTVTLGLAGYGEAYFDRLRVDTITGPSDAQPTPPSPAVDPIARRVDPPRPDPARPPAAGARPRR